MMTKNCAKLNMMAEVKESAGPCPSDSRSEGMGSEKRTMACGHCSGAVGEKEESLVVGRKRKWIQTPREMKNENESGKQN